MEDTTIVGPDIVVIQKQSLLHYEDSQCTGLNAASRLWELRCALHRLKLVTGVEISTRPVSRSGRLGKAVDRTSLSKAAPAKTPTLLCKVMVVDMASPRPY